MLLAYAEAQLIILNVFCPHFAQNAWTQHFLPAYRKCKNAPEKPDDLSKAGWPTPSRQFDPIDRTKYNFLKNMKSNIHLALDKTKPKKGGKKGKAPAEEKVPENCALFVALEYPELQKKALEILAGFEFDASNKIQGDYVSAFKNAFDKKQTGLAMKFASFVLKEAEQIGKEEALALKSPFDEKELLERNRAYVFENFPVKNRVIKKNTEEDIEKSESVRGSAEPGKPSTMFF